LNKGDKSRAGGSHLATEDALIINRNKHKSNNIIVGVGGVSMGFDDVFTSSNHHYYRYK